MTTSWNAVDIKSKWDNFNESLNSIDDKLLAKSAAFPSVNLFSTDEEFRILVNALRNMKNEIQELGKEVKLQTDELEIDVRHFYDIAKDYESEIDVFKKGRDQAFQLYDSLSDQHKKLLAEYEILKAEYNDVSGRIEAARTGYEGAEDSVMKAKEANDLLIAEMSALKIEYAGIQKRFELLSAENTRLMSVKAHEDLDRNELIEKLAKEVKSRNDALVLAEAARNELSRLLGESEKDRMSKEAAEQDREEAVHAVESLNNMIDDLRGRLEESEKMYKHEIMMRHKIEEQLLEAEDLFKGIKAEMDAMAGELDAARQQVQDTATAKQEWMDEKENLLSQVAVIAQQMAKDKVENEKLMHTLEDVQKDFANAKTVSDDAVEKSKQMERIVNQLISEKSQLENKIHQSEVEKLKIIEDSKDAIRIRETLSSTETELKSVSEMFAKEKQLKEEASNAHRKAEEVMTKAQQDLATVKDQIATVTKERDSAKSTLDGVQKVLMSERHSKQELENLHESVSVQLNDFQRALAEERRMKDDALNSLQAEAKSKREALKQLEESQKEQSKIQAQMDKMKAEADASKDKLKEEERAKKDLLKELDSAKKDFTKASTETEKFSRDKEEAARKAAAAEAQAKELEKGWNTEKSEHEKTYKAYFEEKSLRERFEGEITQLKSCSADAVKAAESERVEHGKTFKAYEAEREARSKLEHQVAELRSDVSVAKSTEQSLQAEKAAAEKCIAKLEAKLVEVQTTTVASSSQKSTASTDLTQLSVVQKKYDLSERARADTEARLAAERQRHEELEHRLRDVQLEDEKLRMRMNSAEIENSKLVERIAELEGQLAKERFVKNNLVASVGRSKSPTAVRHENDVLDLD